MKSTKNMLINEAILGYVPSAIDTDRVVDSEYNLQVHLPRVYKTEDAERCVNGLRKLLLSMFTEFDYKTVRLVKHNPYDKAYFHHMSTEEVRAIDPLKLAYQIYSRHIAGCIRTKSVNGCYTNSVSPYGVFITNKDSKPAKS